MECFAVMYVYNVAVLIEDDENFSLECGIDEVVGKYLTDKRA